MSVRCIVVLVTVQILLMRTLQCLAFHMSLLVIIINNVNNRY